MVFTSVPNPLYLDPPNWNQQQAHHQGASNSDVHQLSQPSAALSSAQTAEGGGEARAGGSSMAERARLAKIPQPEAALKCPRCDSTNTKFCYFNNYSLTQPRHFCKTCRRYWTRGGALRSVPVGGGCRRNKRSNSKPSTSSSSKSLSAASAVTSPLGAMSASPCGIFRPAQPQFLAPWHHLSEYGFAGIHHSAPPQIDAAENLGLEQWRIQQIQQFPFLGGLAEPPAAMVPGMYSFDGELVGSHGDHEEVQAHGKMLTVKTEESTQASAPSAAINLPRQFFGLSRNDGQMWQGVGGNNGGGDHGGSGGGGNGGRWISSDNLSGFSSSSAGNFL